MIKRALFIFVLILNITGGFSVPVRGQEHDPLKYEVQVRAMVVPVFAVDAQGNPVFDLREEELRLSVNGQPCSIAQFRRFTFDSQPAPPEIQDRPDADPRGKREQSFGGQDQRVIFIIIDAMFNSPTGFKRSKQIAVELIENGFPGDSFVVLEGTADGSLNHIHGPVPSGKKLVKEVRRMKLRPRLWGEALFSSRTLSHNLFYDISDPRDQKNFGEPYKQHLKLRKRLEKNNYQLMIRRFSRVFSRFKYALRAIQKPKLVFFISEGVKRGAFTVEKEKPFAGMDIEESDIQRLQQADEGGIVQRSRLSRGESVLFSSQTESFKTDALYSTRTFGYVRDIASAVNKGGSVIYTINPRKLNDAEDEMSSGEMSLRYMAREGGGKYFAGSDTRKIVKQIKRTTAAYYELAFSPRLQSEGDLEITISCKRKGVRVHSLNHMERETPYRRMETVQKKLFALNIVSGGEWSRLEGKVRRIRYQKLGREKKGKRVTTHLKIPLPARMWDRELDIFLLEVDASGDETHIDFTARRIERDADIKMKTEIGEDKRLYFVLIDPEPGFCVYNEVI